MKGRERRDAIFEIVRRRGFVVVEALAEHFDVSSQTIRRDIQHLCDANLLVRHHGGAGLPSSIVKTDYAAKRVACLVEKEAIAEAVADYLPDNVSLFLSIGTTTEMVSRALLKRHRLKIITNNLHAAEILHAEAEFDVSVAGGTIRPHNGGIVGPLATGFVEQYRADYAIIGIGAVDSDGTLLDFYPDEVSAAQAMMRNGRRVLLVADHTKFSRTATVAQGKLKDVSVLFTDCAPPAPIARLIERNDIEVVLCPSRRP
ncbi:MAG: DeoR/GlpR family DNA-binding transcription regulator [Rhodospirillales bacterium]|jgi:DeoR/GlpR family transcriptional regulator of sugar metabolism|nr:DeoR/GlpR family DNA-binding transcription regulator [Rhodospirillales bacterium]